MEVDVLAIAAHPDDVEISAAGTVMKLINQGYKVAILDLTAGELGTRGTSETRAAESAEASKLLGLHDRFNIQLADGFFDLSEENKRKIIVQLRRFRPKIVLLNAPHDRHPDHGRAYKLASDACFLSGLRKIETSWEGNVQQEWRPQSVYSYIQDRWIEPSFVVDVSDYADKKIEVLKAYKSQFYDPESDEPETPISGEEFFNFLKGRWSQFGRLIGVKYGEGFVTERPIGIEDITKLF